ncbi:GM20848 [Drosophila sechellia]|uniref:GM20848 n=1 Tax=Drosophila sechellia TaxID=7238 RepID=B4HQC2_DROSE|nr:GM20848 [Drosophila sechellia]
MPHNHNHNSNSNSNRNHNQSRGSNMSAQKFNQPSSCCSKSLAVIEKSSRRNAPLSSCDKVESG